MTPTNNLGASDKPTLPAIGFLLVVLVNAFLANFMGGGNPSTIMIGFAFLGLLLWRNI